MSEAQPCICNLICLAAARGLGESCLRRLKVYKVTRPEFLNQFCVYRSWAEVESEFDGAEDGDIINIQTETMTQADFDKLKDFEGW
jgi:hypothetical protein